VHGSAEYAAALEAKVARQAQELGALLAQLEASRQYGALCERSLRKLAPAHPLPVEPGHLSAAPPTAKETKPPVTIGRGGAPLAATPCCVAPPRGLFGVPAYAVAKDAAWRRVERECAAQIFALKGSVRELDAKCSQLAQQLKRACAERDHRAREAAVAQRSACHLQLQLDDARRRLQEGGSDRTGMGFGASDAPIKSSPLDVASGSDGPRAKSVAAQEAGAGGAATEASALRDRVAALEAALELKAADLLGLDSLLGSREQKGSEAQEMQGRGRAEGLVAGFSGGGLTLEELAAGGVSSPPPPAEEFPRPARERRVGAAALLVEHARLRGESAALTSSLAEARAALAASGAACAELEARNSALAQARSGDRASLEQLQAVAATVAAGPRAAAAAVAAAEGEARQLEAEKQALLDYVQVRFGGLQGWWGLVWGWGL
jgi:hypothetical protein